MLDNQFDPYDALIKIDANMQNLIRAHNALAREVENQAQTIDVLIKGLDAANKANQQLLSQSMDRFLNNLGATGQH